MSDFAQTGLISTFQQLNQAHAPRIEHELGALAKARPITLVLPCHGKDLHGPGLAHIVRELEEAAFLREVIVSLNDLDGTDYSFAENLFAAFKSKVRILWNDGPELRDHWRAVLASSAAGGNHARGNDETPLPSGKGFNLWAAIGIVCAERQSEVIVVQDCDVLSFRRSTLARLCYPCVAPQLDYGFSKMYYSRATDRLYGRVSRLFLAPLLQTIVRVCGHDPLIDFLLSFRYPLAGEFALKQDLAAQVSVESGWGVEIGLICDVFRVTDARHVCQVDGGSDHDHRHHQELEVLARMAKQIAATLLAHFVREGVRVDKEFLSAVAANYRREAALALKRSAELALMTGLERDGAAEAQMIDVFAHDLEHPAETGQATLRSWAELLRDPASRGILQSIEQPK